MAGQRSSRPPLVARGERLDERRAFLRCSTGASQQIDNNLTRCRVREPIDDACTAVDNRVERVDQYDVRTAIDRSQLEQSRLR